MRNFKFKQIAIAGLTSLLIFYFAIPNLIGYVINPKDNVPISLKETVAVAAQKYFDQEPNKDIVFVEELIRKGYIGNNNSLKTYKCDSALSSVQYHKVQNEKERYIVDLFCNANFSVLVMSN